MVLNLMSARFFFLSGGRGGGNWGLQLLVPCEHDTLRTTTERNPIDGMGGALKNLSANSSRPTLLGIYSQVCNFEQSPGIGPIEAFLGHWPVKK